MPDVSSVQDVVVILDPMTKIFENSILGTEKYSSSKNFSFIYLILPTMYSMLLINLHVCRPSLLQQIPMCYLKLLMQKNMQQKRAKMIYHSISLPLPLKMTQSPSLRKLLIPFLKIIFFYTIESNKFLVPGTKRI